MGFLSRSKQQKPAAGRHRIIPDELLAQLPSVGIAVFQGNPPHPDVSGFYLPGFLAAGAPTDPAGMQAFSLQLVTELRDASVRLDQWAAAGAFHVAKDFVSSEFHSEPIFVEVMDRALRFLAGLGTSGAAIPTFALPRFIDIRDGRV